MRKLHTEGKNSRENNSNRTFDKLLKISLIIGIFVVSGFIIYYFLKPEPGYYTDFRHQSLEVIEKMRNPKI